jgi:catechol 2,3-dioxygenase-like lactoylglutathione lyase family enzyme
MIESVQPVLMVSDVKASMSFYERMGFMPVFNDDSNDPRYAIVARDGAVLHLQWHDAAQWQGAQDRPTYRFLVEELDALHAELQRSGALDATSTSPWCRPADTPWATREFHVRDPDGNGLQFCSQSGRGTS